MNKTIEEIKKGNKVATKDLFDIVNLYECTHLTLMHGGQAVMAMQVNEFKTRKDVYEFSQECSANHNKYVIKKDEIVSCDTEWNEKADALFINCQLKNEMRLNMLILFPNDGFKETSSEDFYETDVYSIQEFLDDVIDEKNEWYIILARITDAFGFDVKLRNPFRTFVDTIGEWKLRISDDVTTVEVPVVDDSGNLFYMRETDSTKEIIVKPYGQSFMEIKLLFFKKHNEAEGE